MLKTIAEYLPLQIDVFKILARILCQRYLSKEWLDFVNFVTQKNKYGTK